MYARPENSEAGMVAGGALASEQRLNVPPESRSQA